jgi:hypothetical protein
VFPDLDYGRLKRSCEYFVEHYATAELHALDSCGGNLLERDEASQMSRAYRAVAVAIRNFVEDTQDKC